LRGLFFTLEGPDGSGKSTQAGLIFRYLKKRRIPAVLTREPGGKGSPVAEKLREVLLSSKHKGLTPKAELLLFEASRAQHVHDTILPAFKAGKVVICDRFVDSTLAYQAGGRGLNAREVARLNEQATGGLKPDLTLLFDMAETEGLRRAKVAKNDTSDRMEALGQAFHARVRAAFLGLARKESGRIKLISVAGKTPEEVFAAGLAYLEPLLKKNHGI